MNLHRAWMLSVGLLLVVGTLGCGVKRSPEEKAAIGAIEKLGGRVGYDEENPERPTVLVDFSGAEVNDAHLVHLKGLTSLQGLVLSGTQVSDAGLEHLKGLTSLQRLYLYGTQVTGPGLEHLKGLTSLQSLGLMNTQVTDVGLEYLKGLFSLDYLDLRNTRVTDAGVNELEKALPNVRVYR